MDTENPYREPLIAALVALPREAFEHIHAHVKSNNPIAVGDWIVWDEQTNACYGCLMANGYAQATGEERFGVKNGAYNSPAIADILGEHYGCFLDSHKQAAVACSFDEAATNLAFGEFDDNFIRPGTPERQILADILTAAQQQRGES